MTATALSFQIEPKINKFQVFISPQIRILGNKVFQLYLRLCVEAFHDHKNPSQLAADINITQNMIQYVYQAIKTGTLAGNVPQLLRDAFEQFRNLPGVAAKLSKIKEDTKHRESYLTELLKADAQKI